MEDKILIADDEKSIANAIAYGFRREGYIVEIACDGKEALDKITSFQPNLVILDIMMPKINGFEVCKKISNRADIGIILLTAKNDIVDKVLGLEFGADDFITKPFDMREVIARSKSLLRRLQMTTQESELKEIVIKDLRVMVKQRKVILQEQSIELTPKEFDLITILLSNLERVYTREELLDLVWGMEYIGGTRTVDIHIQRLRKKLGTDYQKIIHTVFGVGYKAAGDFYEDEH
ncbi:response regulator transcription factor [Oceanirhabdus sp. W0125-5]|nr:response regulator transcription factor [Oceanirhabdus sp. W0125-5]WBW99820.1 response regulator transcription factor [Oceanirhabdus sp. W0125-5]